MNNYIKFNDLATECDLLENYIKSNNLPMTRYQLNQLLNRLELKRIKRDLAFEKVNWNEVNKLNNEKENEKITFKTSDYIVRFIIVFIYCILIILALWS